MSAKDIFSDCRSGMRDVLGPLVDLPARSTDTNGYAVIPSVLPVGTLVPLHSHADRETMIVVDGDVEVWLGGGWRTYGPGQIVDIPADVRHAIRVQGEHDVSLILVTTARMAEFLRAVSADQGAPMSPERFMHFGQTAAAFGFWNGSPEDQAAIGLSLPIG